MMHQLSNSVAGLMRSQFIQNIQSEPTFPWLTSPLPVQSPAFLAFFYVAAAITVALPSAHGRSMLSWEACRGVLSLNLRPTDAHLQMQWSILTSDDHGSTGLTTRRVRQITSLPHFRLQRIELCSPSQFTHVHNLIITHVFGHPFTYQHGSTWVRSNILRHLASWSASRDEAEVVPEHKLDPHGQHRW